MSEELVALVEKPGAKRVVRVLDDGTILVTIRLAAQVAGFSTATFASVQINRAKAFVSLTNQSGRRKRYVNLQMWVDWLTHRSITRTTPMNQALVRDIIAEAKSVIEHRSASRAG